MDQGDIDICVESESDGILISNDDYILLEKIKKNATKESDVLIKRNREGRLSVYLDKLKRIG